MSVPRVSIITSIFKASDFLFDFLLDVKRQTIFVESEVLLLDANEDDADFEIIRPFLDISNFKYFKIGNCTVYEAWNKGIDLAESPILTNWNVDDRRSHNSLQYQVEYLENNAQCDLCYGGVLIGSIPNEQFENCQSNRMWQQLDCTIENQLRHNSIHCLPVWRKSIHDRFGYFDTQYFSAADYDMWFKILVGGGQIDSLDKLVGIYYENPTSISRNTKTIDRAMQEFFNIQKKYQHT